MCIYVYVYIIRLQLLHEPHRSQFIEINYLFCGNIIIKTFSENNNI